MRITILGLALLVPALFFLSCTNESEEAGTITLLGGEINGSDLYGDSHNVAIDAIITLTFSGALSPADFESILTIRTDGQNVNFSLTYQNSGSRTVIKPDLKPSTTYELNLQGEIGLQGESLESPLSIAFRTVSEDEVITETDPCTSASPSCLRTVSISDAEIQNTLGFYGNYPIYQPNARWEKLEYAIIVIHGINRNADDYFTWVGSTLRSEGLEENTILIAPKFKIESEAEFNELYWSYTGWREGDASLNTSTVSSFAVLDSIILHLQNTAIFPVLKNIVVTGHSSGGLFSHVYAAANHLDSGYPGISMDYIVANSQYFYYPDGQRINENTGQLFTPIDCSGYTHWPFGYTSAPPYVSPLTRIELNNQFVNRSVYYLLGNGSGPDGAFNDSDCAAVLLGSSRYKRGENMFDYMAMKFPSGNHKRQVVEGVGHNGQGVYQSGEFKGLLQDVLD